MRKDAAENRRRLIEAARDVMREGGHDAALEVVAERAGLTRGTLYRNFADRAELFQAVLDHEIALIRAEVDRTDRCGIFFVMRKLIEVGDLYHALVSARQETSKPGEPCSPADLMRDIIAAPLAAAKAEGIIRASATEEDILLASRMVAFGWQLDGAESREAAIDRRLLLVIRGLATDPDLPTNRRPAP